MTLQLLACLARAQLLAACKLRATREIQSRVPVSLHNLEHFFTLSRSLPLHESHLNTGLLIAKIQANLTWNKANKMVDKIKPYNTICLEAKKMWENVFSKGFSKTQSNTLKYFHLKILYTLKSFYIEPNLGFCSCSYVLVYFFFFKFLTHFFFC